MAASRERSAASDDMGAAGAAAELAAALRRQAADTAALMAAEARLAGVSLVAMINGLVFAGLCVLTGWGLLVAFVVWSLAAAGLPLGPVFGGLAVLHIVMGYVLWRMTMRLARHLEFEATRRQLKIIDRDGRA
jgi:hypothetical protein